ncbi:MAG: HAMP domain-containing protein [Proteobacteria bacterium]|nr:HAMP domain-containing protein [Pseudomonadota bacterium]
MRQPTTLFTRTYVTLTVTLLLFLLLSTVSLAYFVLIPVSKRAANDLAGLIILSTRTWVELPPGTRPDFERELHEKHELAILHTTNDLEAAPHLPYIQFLEAALIRLSGKPIRVMYAEKDNIPKFYVDVAVADRILRVSFPLDRVGARPPAAILYILALGIVLILLSSLYLVRRITIPVTKLSDATSRVGKGQKLTLLPETGPREIRLLTQHFNKMSREIDSLLLARTTLFAGISHDLRTPITRIQLALELLSKDPTPELIARIRQDLDEMNQLISDTMDLSRGLSSHEHEEVDLYEFVSSVVDTWPAKGSELLFSSRGSCHCTVDTLALRRVLENLIDNALRYGGGSAVELCCGHTDTEIFIQVLDRGAGIPARESEAVFQPFYRLEHSRSRSTGGSGLGLAIVKHLCDVNGWHVQLGSRSGGGTEVRLVIQIMNLTQ